MSKKQQLIIKIYMAFCFIISFIMGIIGNVGFFNILLRGILFAVGGGIIAFALVSLFPIFLKVKQVQVQSYGWNDEDFEGFSDEDIDISDFGEDTSDDDAQVYTSPNAGVHAQIYSNNNVELDEVDTQSTGEDIEFSQTEEEDIKSSQDTGQRQEVNPFGGKYDEKSEDNLMASTETMELDGVTNGNHGNQKFFESTFDDNDFVPHTTYKNNAFESYSGATLPHVDKKEGMGLLGKLVLQGKNKKASNAKESLKEKEVSKEVVKTVKEFRNSPEKVGKAVASWMKNSDNSK